MISLMESAAAMITLLEPFAVVEMGHLTVCELIGD